jgi:serine/threonine protein kinase
MDALVAERLTASPRIYDIYGLCGLGIMSEYFPHGDMFHVAVPGKGAMPAYELHDEYEVKPQNSLTGLKKLEISTQMAEALADLHGNSAGVIVHNDVKLVQFLWTSDKSMLKLNDFNRAEHMLFDEENNEYCRYARRGNGKVRRGNGKVRIPTTPSTPCMMYAYEVSYILVALVAITRRVCWALSHRAD